MRGIKVLKLNDDDETQEIEFELSFLRRLTTHQRFQMMFAKTKELVQLSKRNANRKTAQMIKRT
ncbi:MAG: hypothetical protein A3G87_10390 [Omnitrophica bacterium RIFCSPLOWO2_12_FULL_50_11]|nr:MAG: hypothetical protein A3G87_10390 [Omnitrophica bacterium RIFCSPLOWO2_12_FULL_50_11]